ncbi:MAG: hypothetical protein U9O78_02705 [Patescibacteria group bacterium]|nr:hypothetical protein [Patescibacteria group bacterium]
MHKTTLSTILGLSRFSIMKCLESPHKILIYVKPRRKTGDCTNCGKKSSSTHEYRPPQTIKLLKAAWLWV